MEENRKRKVAVHTEALGPIHSGGIRCIVYFLNILKKRGYDVCAFVDVPPFDSTWLSSNFPVLSSNSKEYLQFDGILISPYSPTAKRVAEHKNAAHRIYWCHTFEGAFEHNGAVWMKQAIDSYRLKNIHFMATSNYVAAFLNLIFKQKVLPYRVPGGVDSNVFKFDQDTYDEKMKLKTITFCMLNRPEPLRGINIGLQAFDLLQKEFGDDIVEMKLFANVPQNEMYRHYGLAHFFLDPSLLAGSAIPPLESMACGTPIISTIFGTMDYIKDGENGFFINAGDIQHTYRIMKECVELFLDKNKKIVVYYQQLVDEARTTAARYTWERMVNNFEANMGYLNG
jgi:glycosyltransferase involved in cell wall biosynthesis